MSLQQLAPQQNQEGGQEEPRGTPVVSHYRPVIENGVIFTSSDLSPTGIAM